MQPPFVDVHPRGSIGNLVAGTESLSGARRPFAVILG